MGAAARRSQVIPWPFAETQEAEEVFQAEQMKKKPYFSAGQRSPLGWPAAPEDAAMGAGSGGCMEAAVVWGPPWPCTGADCATLPATSCLPSPSTLGLTRGEVDHPRTCQKHEKTRWKQ